MKIFLESNLSLILILLATVVGLAALGLTPREEDPQIVVPLADVYVNFPGHSAAEVEQLVTTPLEKILYQIDGVEYVYSMSRENQAIITVRYYVGEDRERSLVKLQKKLDENLDIVPPGVTGWVVKPVEIDDVPAVTLTLASATLRRRRLAPRGRRGGPAAGRRAGRVAGVCRGRASRAWCRCSWTRTAWRPTTCPPWSCSGPSRRPTSGRRPAISAASDKLIRVEAGKPFENAQQLRDLVVGVFDGRPVFLKDVAKVEDGPEEVASYVRHGWGPARGFTKHEFFPGTVLGESCAAIAEASSPASESVRTPGSHHRDRQEKGLQCRLGGQCRPAPGRRAATEDRARRHGDGRHPQLRPDGQRKSQRTGRGRWPWPSSSSWRCLTLGLGWREALIVAVAVPVVFGLTLAVNLMLGYTINRVTLFALILSLGLLVDDPDRRRGEHRPALRPAQEGHAAHRPGGGRRNPPAA